MRLSWIFLTLFLPGCHAAIPSTDEAGCTITKGYDRLLRRADDPYDHWHMRVDKKGAMLWGGQPINLAELGTYTAQLSKLPKEAGRLSLEIQDGAPCTKVEAVRSVIAASQLCKNGRCVEAEWDIDVPFVN